MSTARSLAATTAELADTLKAWVFDRATFRVFSAMDFHDHMPGARLDAHKLIIVHRVSGDNAMPFADTSGLRRFGLHELYMRDLPPGSLHTFAELLNGVAQTMLDGGDVDASGNITVDFKTFGWDVNIIGKGTGRATLHAQWHREPDVAMHDGGDDLFVELVPVTGPGSENLSEVSVECFGREDSIVTAEADDPELEAAAKQARADLVKMRAHFAHGVPVGELLSIKAAFTEDATVEWMWIDVFAIRGDVYEGTLANIPELVHNVRPGQKVKIKHADVADYVHMRGSEKLAGGYSTAVFDKRGE